MLISEKIAFLPNMKCPPFNRTPITDYSCKASRLTAAALSADYQSHGTPGTKHPILSTGILLTLLCMLLTRGVFSQQTYIPYGTLSNHILDRLEIKSGHIANDHFHSALKSYRRKAIAEYVDSFETGAAMLSKQDYFNLAYLQADNFEWSNSEATLSTKPVFKELYRRKAALYSVQIPDFNLVVNPVFNYEMASASYSGKLSLLNNRGIEIRGNLTDKVGFYTRVSDEILNPLPHVGLLLQRDTVIPGVGFYKTVPQINYFLASAYVSFSLNKYMDWQFGHGRNFIGDGHRSFILSDYSTDHLFLRLNTRVWKINYTNIFSQYNDYTSSVHNIQSRHYSATHHLSVNIGRNLNIGAFETIIFQRDSGYTNTGFELNYLNPIVFYKAIENGLNSSDKAVIGMNYKYNFLRHFSWYGQFVISELVLNELLAGNGWWGNKWAIQAGLKYIDAFKVKNLDLQAEVNICRPYMYTSFMTGQSFTNYRQPLAHPLGANFRELVAIVKYQPLERLFIQAKGIFYEIGYDGYGSNWGQNIALDYDTHPNEYGNAIGQGYLTHVYFLELAASYMVKHNLFLDLRATSRYSDSELAFYTSDNTWISAGVRLNLAQRNWDY